MASISYGFGHFYRQAYLAVTDFLFYREVLHQPLRQTLVYLLYLCAHISILLTAMGAWTYGPRFHDFSEWALENLPPFEVREGTLHVRGAQPIVLHYPAGEGITVVFDTAEEIPRATAYDEPVVLFTRDRLIIRYGGNTQTHLWKDLHDFATDREGLGRFLEAVKWVYFPLAYSFLLVYQLAAKSLWALCLTLFALSAGARYGLRLPFSRCFSLGLYSLTPAVVVDMGLIVIGQVFPYFHLIYLATAVIYTYLGTARAVAAE